MSHDRHFLRRLERVSPVQADLALALYRDPQLIQYILGHIRRLDGHERVAIALEEGDDSPHVIVQRSGTFVTCLGAGMSVNNIPRISRGELERLGDKWSLLRDATEQVRERGDLSQLYQRILTGGCNVSREDMVTMTFLQPIMGPRAHGVVIELHEHLQTVRVNYQPRRYRRLTPRTRDQLEGFWQYTWALGHLTALYGSYTSGLMKELSSKLGIMADAAGMISWQTTRTMMVPVVLRGTWAAAHAGRKCLSAYKHQFEDAQTRSQFLDSGLALTAIGLRHSRARAEVTKVLARGASPVLDPSFDLHDPTTVPIWDVMKLMFSGDTKRDVLISMYQEVGARDMVTNSQVLPEDHPMRFNDPDAVPRDLVLPLMLLSPVSLWTHPEAAVEAILMLNWLSAVDLPDMYLPAAFLDSFPHVWQPNDTLTHLDAYRSFYGKKRPVRAERKIGRNEPCPCGSGNKYKRCCGRDGGQPFQDTDELADDAY